MLHPSNHNATPAPHAANSTSAGESVQLFDLGQPEWDAFAGAIAGIAREQERKPNEFDSYVDWLER
jgi:hypothetical protein